MVVISGTLLVKSPIIHIHTGVIGFYLFDIDGYETRIICSEEAVHQVQALSCGVSYFIDGVQKARITDREDGSKVMAYYCSRCSIRPDPQKLLLHSVSPPGCSIGDGSDMWVGLKTHAIDRIGVPISISGKVVSRSRSGLLEVTSFGESLMRHDDASTETTTCYVISFVFYPCPPPSTQTVGDHIQRSNGVSVQELCVGDYITFENVIPLYIHKRLRGFAATLRSCFHYAAPGPDTLSNRVQSAHSTVVAPAPNVQATSSRSPWVYEVGGCDTAMCHTFVVWKHCLAKKLTNACSDIGYTEPTKDGSVGVTSNHCDSTAGAVVCRTPSQLGRKEFRRSVDVFVGHIIAHWLEQPPYKDGKHVPTKEVSGDCSLLESLRIPSRSRSVQQEFFNYPYYVDLHLCRGGSDEEHLDSLLPELWTCSECAGKIKQYIVQKTRENMQHYYTTNENNYSTEWSRQMHIECFTASACTVRDNLKMGRSNSRGSASSMSHTSTSANAQEGLIFGSDPVVHTQPPPMDILLAGSVSHLSADKNTVVLILMDKHGVSIPVLMSQDIIHAHETLNQSLEQLIKADPNQRRGMVCVKNPQLVINSQWESFDTNVRDAGESFRAKIIDGGDEPLPPSLRRYAYILVSDSSSIIVDSSSVSCASATTAMDSAGKVTPYQLLQGCCYLGNRWTLPPRTTRGPMQRDASCGHWGSASAMTGRHVLGEDTSRACVQSPRMYQVRQLLMLSPYSCDISNGLKIHGFVGRVCHQVVDTMNTMYNKNTAKRRKYDQHKMRVTFEDAKYALDTISMYLPESEAVGLMTGCTVSVQNAILVLSKSMKFVYLVTDKSKRLEIALVGTPSLSLVQERSTQSYYRTYSSHPTGWLYGVSSGMGYDYEHAVHTTRHSQIYPERGHSPWFESPPSTTLKFLLSSFSSNRNTWSLIASMVHIKTMAVVLKCVVCNSLATSFATEAMSTVRSTHSKWHCSKCDSRCVHPVWEAMVVIDDGTAECHLLIEDSNTIKQILNVRWYVEPSLDGNKVIDYHNISANIVDARSRYYEWINSKTLTYGKLFYSASRSFQHKKSEDVLRKELESSGRRPVAPRTVNDTDVCGDGMEDDEDGIPDPQADTKAAPTNIGKSVKVGNYYYTPSPNEFDVMNEDIRILGTIFDDITSNLSKKHETMKIIASVSALMHDKEMCLKYADRNGGGGGGGSTESRRWQSFVYTRDIKLQKVNPYAPFMVEHIEHLSLNCRHLLLLATDVHVLSPQSVAALGWELLRSIQQG